MTLTKQAIQDDQNIRRALSLIKEHVTSAETQQNRDLHEAIRLVVGVARHYNLLDAYWGARLLREMVAPMMYTCDGCARDIERGGISDDEGNLQLTGRTGNFYALCCLCGAPATHEAEHVQEVQG